jgi:hypothetical protein
MKPLLPQDISAFLKRFENFKDADFRSLEVLSPTNIKISFAVQDTARAFDWITIILEFQDLVDAALVPDNQLSYIDMSEGIHLSYDENYTLQIINATFFLKAKTLKFEEGTF